MAAVVRGDCHRAQGDGDLAILDYKQALDLEPGNWTFKTRLSIAHYLKVGTYHFCDVYLHYTQYITIIQYNATLPCIISGYIWYGVDWRVAVKWEKSDVLETCMFSVCGVRVCVCKSLPMRCGHI